MCVCVRAPVRFIVQHTHGDTTMMMGRRCVCVCAGLWYDCTLEHWHTPPHRIASNAFLVQPTNPLCVPDHSHHPYAHIRPSVVCELCGRRRRRRRCSYVVYYSKRALFRYRKAEEACFYLLAHLSAGWLCVCVFVYAPHRTASCVCVCYVCRLHRRETVERTRAFSFPALSYTQL